jgi:small GTP-binding protein
METEYDYLFKIVLIGDAGVGKTSIVRRYTDGIFTSAGIPTIGVDFCIKTLQIGSSAVKLQIWDTAGQERFRTITQSYYRSADAIVLVYDIGASLTFRNLPEWLAEVERYAGNSVHRILIGNKIDRPDREIENAMGKQFADENGMPFLETSAKNSENIDALFLQLAKTLRDTHVDKKLKSPHSGVGGASVKPNTVSLTKTEKKAESGGGSGCC